MFQRSSVCELPFRRRGKKTGGGVSVTARFLLYCQAVHPATVSCALLSVHYTSYFVGIVCCQLERELIKPREVSTLWRKTETESEEEGDKKHLKVNASPDTAKKEESHILDSGEEVLYMN